MAHSALLPACLCLLAGAGAVKIGDMEQGAEFTKCVKITDYQSKTLADDITLVDRDTASGCCPKDSVPGAKWTSSYQSPQIVCGFKSDGTVATSTTSGTNTKCTYNKCYVYKQNIECADGTRQLLNGCCAKTTKANTGFKADCKNYYSSFSTVHSDKVQYCTTYHKNYGTIGWAGTTAKTDDQKDGKLVVDKIYTYSKCAGSGAGSAPAPAASGAARAVAGLAVVVAVVMDRALAV